MCLIAAFEAPALTGAAANTDSIQPLQIGDKIPEELWHLPLQVVNHPPAGGKETITLNDYRDSELLILEFWGFPCSGCIQTVNKLDSIKDGFEPNQFAVLPIHILPFDYDETRMLELVEGTIQRNEWSLPSVVKDTALYSLFGQYLADWGDVWISHGRLLAVPTHGYINVETIASVVNDGFADFKNRYNLLPINPYQPLLVDGNGSGEVLHQSIHGTLTGHIPHQNAMRFKFEHRGDLTSPRT